MVSVKIPTSFTGIGRKSLEKARLIAKAYMENDRLVPESAASRFHVPEGLAQKVFYSCLRSGLISGERYMYGKKGISPPAPKTVISAPPQESESSWQEQTLDATFGRTSEYGGRSEERISATSPVTSQFGRLATSHLTSPLETKPADSSERSEEPDSQRTEYMQRLASALARVKYEVDSQRTEYLQRLASALTAVKYEVETAGPTETTSLPLEERAAVAEAISPPLEERVAVEAPEKTRPSYGKMEAKVRAYCESFPVCEDGCVLDERDDKSEPICVEAGDIDFEAAYDFLEEKGLLPDQD